MDDEARRKDLLKKARSLIAKDGSDFTVASLCKKSRLSRTQLRRIFPTKAALIAALDKEIIAEPPAKPTETKPAHENSDWVEQRLRVLQRAIALLEKRIDAVSAEQARYASCHEEEGVEDAPPVASPPPELPPLAIVEYPVGPTRDVPKRDAVSLDSSMAPEPVVPPVLEVPLLEAPAPSMTRDMPDNTRALANTATERKIRGEKSELTNEKLTLIGAAAIVVVGLVVGLASVGGAARATQASFGTDTRTLAKASGVTIINATGAAVIGQMTPTAQAMAARAEKGDTGAQAELAMAYLRGDGVVSDPAAAAGWAGLAATRGQSLGQFILGTLYNSGIKPDAQLGFRWMSAAALNGNVKAMHNVAVAFLSGSGVDKNPGQAANWFNKAASMGYRDSAFDLAVLYERGEGVAQNTQRALYWYDNAAAAGDKEAAQRASLLRFGVPEIAGNLDTSGRTSRLQ
jgi:AcrR family transcriptional regulator